MVMPLCSTRWVSAPLNKCVHSCARLFPPGKSNSARHMHHFQRTSLKYLSGKFSPWICDSRQCDGCDNCFVGSRVFVCNWIIPHRRLPVQTDCVARTFSASRSQAGILKAIRTHVNNIEDGVLNALFTIWVVSASDEEKYSLPHFFRYSHGRNVYTLDGNIFESSSNLIFVFMVVESEEYRWSSW